ncbi:hypothetical protein IQ266_03640 [filamentous cyanobacterium LEGE 11480]|uniref:Carrier domain-containing protein n=1 Tax=Romeriopsis navalis LEGE 11480 TaxID=2777977 RepID=A0A928VJG3_9CYAN|nr:condensation domain-containing protein [Romeriopsis navalis]MBE9028853.1 hypothetical protein [Romeriopsis navalis LEGE 11480]
MMSINQLYQRVANLSPAQRLHLAAQLQQSNIIEAGTLAQPAAERLVAYVVPRPNTEANLTALRNALNAQLPRHMVPTVIVPLPEMPRTANGKIDTNLLPEPTRAEPNTTRSPSPQTPTEKILAQIWGKVLGIEHIGIHDNFFELGGDSILSIQIVSQAREAGLKLAPNQLFEQPTVAELATMVNLSPNVTIDQGAVTGAVPLTPIQHWFFEQAMVAPHHWNQAKLFELPPGINRAVVETAIATLWQHHDALRLQFEPSPAGYQQTNALADQPPQLVTIDLTDLDELAQSQAVREHSGKLHANLDLAAGGLLRTAHFTRGETQPSWLLISLHHLVVDHVSWQILQRDLNRLFDPTDRLAPLPQKTTAFQTWANALQTQTVNRQSEANLWLSQVEPPSMPLPRDHQATSIAPTEATSQTTIVRFDAANTQALLQTVPAVHNTRINDVLLTALAQTLLQWDHQATSAVRVDLEAHGRESIADDVDLSRTVGWFTTTYPVRLQLDNNANQDTAIKSIKEQLRQIPDRGIGYGILRYLSQDPIQQRLAQAGNAEILFNYLGQDNQATTDHPLKIIQNIDLGPLRDPRNPRHYLLEINAWISDGQLQMHWIYDQQIYLSTTITTLADNYLSKLTAIIAHCTSNEPGGGFTPSDFPDADFEQSELNDFLDQLTQ